MKIFPWHITYAICGFFITTISNSSAWAQDSLALFHPLSKGNVWIYYFSSPFGNNYYQRLEVVGDSTVDGKTYRIVAETNMDGSNPHPRSLELYDTMTGCYYTRAGKTEVLQDSTITQTPYVGFGVRPNDRIFERLGTRPLFDLQMATREITEGAVVKEDVISWIYAYGLGLMLADDLQLVNYIPRWVQTLVYAKINGTEYGKIPVKVEDRNNELPSSIVLSQNFPNPFNPSTTISFSLPSRSCVTLKIFDVMGREVSTLVSEELSPGNYSRTWDAAAMASGVYFYQLRAGSFTETKHLLLMR